MSVDTLTQLQWGQNGGKKGRRLYQALEHEKLE